MIPRFLVRLQYFDLLLQKRLYPSSRAIRERFNVHPSTAKRDIRIFRKFFKAPLEYDRTHHGYHYTQKDWRWID